MKPVPTLLRRRIIVAGILAASTVLGGATLTNAAWVDNEYVQGRGVGTDGRCEKDSGTATTASAQQLAGDLMGTSMANVAAAQGVQVFNDGAGSTTPSAGAIRIDDNTFMAPLDVDLLGADLVRLSLPLGLPVGSADAYSQWSQTLNNGNATAATGLVTNSGGAIALGEPANPADPPVMATLDLGSLVPPELAGMTLDIGAASSLAYLEQCGDLGNGWLGPLEQPQVERTYGVSLLDLDAEMQELDSAVTGTEQLLDGIPAKLDDAEAGLELAIAAGFGPVDAPLIEAVTLGSVDAAVNMGTPDLGPVRTLLQGTRTDDGGLLTVDFGTGIVSMDLAKTAGGANGLNGMAPNTEVIANQAMTQELAAALTQVLADWRDDVTSALVTAIRTTPVSVTAAVHVQSMGVPLAVIDLALGPVTAGQLIDVHNGVPGTPVVPVTSSINMLGLELPTDELKALASDLASDLPGIAGKALYNELVVGVVGQLETSLTDLADPVAPALAYTLSRLSSLLSIMVNVQPDQPGHPEPSSSGPFSVSALRLSLVDASGALNLSLATSSVGHGTRP